MMFKSVALVGGVAALVAFAAGCYVGYRTTLIVLDNVMARNKKKKHDDAG